MRQFLLSHSPIFAHFNKSHKDFIVRERPAYEFSGDGEHLILQIAKKDLTTKDLITDLSAATGAKAKDIGFAGLKDKDGLTEQFISIPRKFEANLSCFNHPKVKILSTQAHANKLKIGHLKGNSFFIRLKKVSPLDALKLEQAFKALDKFGYANYFGYQRFGKDGNNAQTAISVLKNEAKFSKRLNKFLISALQSELFNNYLSARVALSRLFADLKPAQIKQACSDIASISTLLANCGINDPEQIAAKLANEQINCVNNFALFDNDVYLHYPKGKIFNEHLDAASARFKERDISPAGLLLGAKPSYSEGFASILQKSIYDPYEQLLSKENSSHRHLISFIDELSTRYDAEQAHFCVEFFLQKGSYATVVLEHALNCELSN